MTALLDLAVAYLLGAIPFGYLLVRWKTGGDVRSSGSGNIGATNVLRTSGRAAGIATLLLDVGKGAAAVLLARWIGAGSSAPLEPMAVLGVVLGHVFPVTLGFRGGKGVACAVGAGLVM